MEKVDEDLLEEIKQLRSFLCVLASYYNHHYQLTGHDREFELFSEIVALNIDNFCLENGQPTIFDNILASKYAYIVTLKQYKDQALIARLLNFIEKVKSSSSFSS